MATYPFISQEQFSDSVNKHASETRTGERMLMDVTSNYSVRGLRAGEHFSTAPGPVSLELFRVYMVIMPVLEFSLVICKKILSAKTLFNFCQTGLRHCSFGSAWVCLVYLMV